MIGKLFLAFLVGAVLAGGVVVWRWRVAAAAWEKGNAPILARAAALDSAIASDSAKELVRNAQRTTLRKERDDALAIAASAATEAKLAEADADDATAALAIAQTAADSTHLFVERDVDRVRTIAGLARDTLRLREALGKEIRSSASFEVSLRAAEFSRDSLRTVERDLRARLAIGVPPPPTFRLSLGHAGALVGLGAALGAGLVCAAAC